MKSLTQINLDYAKAMRQADELDRVASDLDKLADSEFQGCLQNISSNWKGVNAQNYIKKGNKLKGDINKSAQQLRKVASTIRKIAERTRAADLAARAIALSSG